MRDRGVCWLVGLWRRGASRLLVIAATSCIFWSAQPKAQGAIEPEPTYSLQPGDRLRLTMLGLPVEPMTAQIGIAGTVTFPFLGRFDVAGLSIEALQETLGLAATGTVVSLYTPAGERLQLVLDGSDVFLSVENYRPVYMTGDVARRGPVEYTPGMTVRTALASVGGATEVPVSFEQALLQEPELRSVYQTLATEHANAVVALWGIDATLARDTNHPAPAPEQVAINPDLLSRFVSAERANVAFMLQNFERRETALIQQIAALSERIDRSSALLLNQEQLLDLENRELEQVQGLIDRQLTAVRALTEARQGVLGASSSVISAQGSLADLTLTRQQLQEQLDLLAFTQEGTLREQRSEVVPRVLVLSAQLQAAQRELEMNGIIVGEAGIDEPTIAFEIARTSGGASFTSSAAATLDTSLLPGDVVDVTLTYQATSFGTLSPMSP